MFRNVANQNIGSQLITKADGSPFSGIALVVIDGDGNGQISSSGIGPTSAGHGYYNYQPTQAETNYSHIAFTFYDAAGLAIPSTIQVDTHPIIPSPAPYVPTPPQAPTSPESWTITIAPAPSTDT